MFKNYGILQNVAKNNIKGVKNTLKNKQFTKITVAKIPVA